MDPVGTIQPSEDTIKDGDVEGPIGVSSLSPCSFIKASLTVMRLLVVFLVMCLRYLDKAQLPGLYKVYPSLLGAQSSLCGFQQIKDSFYLC